ncbi:MAG TPA: polymer-forming cytoskeletal protein [Thermodesulfobacteriota bacterium]|jgi:cytoskeletal protein CcmA (bactofilin family)
MFTKERPKIDLNPKPEEVTALIGEGCLFEGNITSPSSSRVEGVVRGNFNVKGGLVIGERGVVSGEIKAVEVTVYGKVESGMIETQRLEIKKGSSVTADVFTQSIIIEDGAIYNGKCMMDQSAEKIMGSPFMKQ